MEYTAEWVNNVGLPQRAQSSCPLRSMETYQQRKVALSAPAMSVRSKTSKTARARSLIEMELKQMKERQKLNKESRELEQEMKRDELERQRKWAGRTKGKTTVTRDGSQVGQGSVRRRYGN